MKIRYIDEYGDQIDDSESDAVPRTGETIIIDQEYTVTSVNWYPIENSVIVEMTTQISTKKAPGSDPGRLNEVRTRIIELSRRQDVSDKKVRAVREQTASIRKHINTQIQKENKNDP